MNNNCDKIKLIASIVLGFLMFSSCGTDSGLMEMFEENSQTGTGSIFVADTTEEGVFSYLVTGGKKTDVKVEGIVEGVMSTADGSSSIGYVILPDGDNILYHFDEDSADYIVNGVKSIAISSASGDVVYKTSEGLFFYESETMESTLITAEDGYRPVLSPNGTCVAYLEAQESEYVEGIYKYRLMLWKNGRVSKLHQLDEDYVMYPVGVPDSGEFVYATRKRDYGLDAAEYLYTVTTSSTEIIEEDSANMMLLNRTQDTLLYYASKDRTVYLVKGKEKTPVIEGFNALFLDELTLVEHYGAKIYDNTSGYGNDMWYSIVYDIDTFDNQTLHFFGDPALDTDCVYYKTINSAGADTGMPNYLLKSGDIELNDTLIAEDMYHMYSDSAGKAFYTDIDSRLYVYFENTGSVVIEEEIEDIYGILNGNFYYLRNEPETGKMQFCVHDGISCRVIHTGDIYSVRMVRDSIYFYAGNETGTINLYAVANGDKPKLVLSDINT